MERKLFSALLLAAAVASSCSKNEVYEVLQASDNVDVLSINTAVGATRGADLTTSDLTTTGKTVNLYYVQDAAQDTGGTSDFSALTKNVFTYGESGWSGDEVTWAALGYPTYFYSAHDGAAKLLTNSTEGTLDYTVDAVKSTDHADLVAYAAKIEAIPTGGTLSVIHKHVLSKINILAGVGDGTAYITSVALNNMNPSNTLKLSDGTATWSDASGDVVDYTYDIVLDSDSGIFTASDANSNVVTLATTTNSMKIVPQVSTAVGGESDLSADKESASYIEVMACMIDENGGNILGLAKAQDYVGYNDLILVKGSFDTATTKYEEGTTLTVDPEEKLFVKLGFALSNLEFVGGNQYDLTLDLGLDGTVGGVIMSSSYYTADGTIVTPIVVVNEEDGTAEESDSVLPDEGTETTPSDTTALSISVTVSSWNTATVLVTDGTSTQTGYTEADDDK